MSKKRKTYNPAEKAKIVLEVLREESTLNEIATDYGVSPQLISRWKREFIENMPAVFDKKNTEVEQLKKEHFAEKEELINQIGQLTVDVNWLKKTRSSLRNTGKKELIEVDNQKITVKHQCELLGLPRSTAYYKSRGVSEPSQEEVDIKNAVNKIRFDECAYGCRRIWNELRKQDFRDIGKRRVRRYMEEMGIVPFYSGPNLNKRELQERTYSYLLRNVAIMHVNQVWGIDITYCGTLKGFMYLVAIID